MNRSLKNVQISYAQYLYLLENVLDNPVYYALITGDSPLALGNDSVRYFNEAVSPFAGFPSESVNGFDELFEELPAGRKILYATRKTIAAPKGWHQRAHIAGLQFVFDHPISISQPGLSAPIEIIPLSDQHVTQMVALAALTRPGPFNSRTIDFGHYYGIFEREKLVAMTGQRLHPGDYTEVSAVCTHPDYLGKGYAAALLQHQLAIIAQQHQVPFLHVREDNNRAIMLYERLGFKVNGPMQFYFLEKEPG
jgi:ribosomal protein S18 acetylase RimI-like enzyme